MHLTSVIATRPDLSVAFSAKFPPSVKLTKPATSAALVPSTMIPVLLLDLVP